MSTRATSSIDCLEARIASIPEALAVAAKVPLPKVRDKPRTLITTGIGASEGPARLCAHAIAEAGIAARFEPLAAFAVGALEADLLVVFSQNLSPNACLALAPEHRFRARWLVTSVGMCAGASSREPLVSSLRDAGVVPIVVPPESEDGMLVRVAGPAVASLLALRIAAVLGAPSLAEIDFADASAAYAAGAPAHALGDGDFALVAAGVSIERVHGHRWKLLEALLRGDPSLWDVLQIAHGPLQTFHERSMTLLVFTTPGAASLVSRLEETLDATRHRVIRIEATRKDALAFFEHLAALDALLLATLRASPRDLFEWPGRGLDAPLYGLGERSVTVRAPNGAQFITDLPKASASWQTPAPDPEE